MHPCVGKISDNKYEQDVDMVSLFLNGKASKLLNQVSQKMKDASIDLDFEAAAKYRDQLIGLRTIQERHGSQFSSDMDVVSIVNDADTHCIELVFVREANKLVVKLSFQKMQKMIRVKRF